MNNSVDHVLLTDEVLALSYQEKGCMESFSTLVTRYNERIFGFIHGITRQREEAEDLTQETFLLVFRKINTYNPNYPFRPWLFRIARRRAISAWRRKKPTELFDPEIHSPSDAIEPTSQERAEELWLIARQHLKPNAFTILWLHYREDFSIKEISTSTKKSESAVKVILHRARTKLAKHIDPTKKSIYTLSGS